MKKALNNYDIPTQKMRARIFVSFVSTLWFILSLSGCTSYPSERDAKKAFETHIKIKINEQVIDKKQIDDGVIEILSFRKVNAQSREESGVKIYVVEYEAEIKYPKGLNLKYKHCLDTSKFQGWECYSLLWRGLMVRDKGQNEKLRDEIVFEKTEKGWRDKLGNIY